MKLTFPIVRNSLLLIAALLAFCGLRADAQTTPENASVRPAQSIPARITQAIDAKNLVQLRGNVHPLALPEFDQGLVADAQPMNRMLLLLKRSLEQQAALQQLMAEQQSKDSPNFHKWLTPQEFGAQFGPADADIQTVSRWLTAQGFQGIKVSPGKMVIEFSGNVGTVRNSFHAEIHKFSVEGDARQANVSDPQIPAALTPVVAGIVSLHNFPKKSMRHDVGNFARMEDGRLIPQFTGSGGNFFAIGPADFAKIYNIPPALDGTGVKIAIVGFSNIDIQDVLNYRSFFGLLPANNVTVVSNGPLPVINGEEGEADLDLQVAGAVAPKATVDFVTSEDTLTSGGLELSAEYVVDNNSDDVMSLSFGTCELGLGTENAFFNTLWEEAAAQGITVTVSAGDGGSAGCDNFNTAAAAARGIAVSGIASTPFNIAVGGTDFDDVGTQISGGFWSATNGAGRLSAQGYIHEMTWNDSCAATATIANLTTCVTPGAGLANIVAGSGGPSGSNSGTFLGYAKPAFQNGVTPADGARDLPDVSLFASDGPQSKSFYLICQADAVPSGSPPSCATSGTITIQGAGGTSASSPAFAGIIALINQSEATRTGKSGRQGNANLVLYKIAATAGQSCNSTTTLLTGSTCSFNDVTKGNISVPCVGNSPNCSAAAGTVGVLATGTTTKAPAFTTAAGYDLATGLGSVNVTNLAAAWPAAVGSFKGTTTSLTINGGPGPVTITHGALVTAAVTVAVVGPATGTPTGDVSLIAPTAKDGGVDFSTLSGGTKTFSTTFLPGGSYNVTAHYAGDGVFAPSDSSGVPVVVTKEASRLQVGIVTFDPVTGNISSTNATSFAYGSPYILRIDILNSTANACQPPPLGVVTTGCAKDATGTVTITDNGSPLDGGTFLINSEGHAEDQPIQLSGGAHTLLANYPGDISYSASAQATLSLTVSKAATATGVAAAPTTATTATPVVLTAAVVAPTSSGVGPTAAAGALVFSANGTAIAGTPTIVSVPADFSVNPPTPPTMTATLITTFTTAGTKTISATYAGDGNYSGSATTTSATVTVTQAQVGSFTVAGTATTAAAGASGTSTVTVTPSGGFTGNVAVSCTAASLPPGVSCTPSPLNINVTGASAVTGQLTVSVMAPSTTLTASFAPTERILAAYAIPPHAGGKGWLALSAGTGFAALFLFFLPGRRRYRAALGMGLVCVLSFALGCGGGSSAPPPPPTLTATTTKVMATTAKVPSGTAFTLAVAVTGGTPTGQVQLFDNGTAIGTAAAVTNGAASLSTGTALAVGTHSISAHYAGDSTTQASQSGSLNLTVTGTTSVAISASPAAASATPISVTIN